jgi:hypothetical protein
MPLSARKALLGVAVVTMGLAIPRAASAERAAYATPGELGSDGLPHLLDLALLGEYARIADPDEAGGLRDVGTFALRSRLYLGRTVSYCAGVDGEVGGSNAGFVYGLTGYLAGIGTRWGTGNVISLCGGVGLDRFGTALPRATRFPVELSTALSLGPVRPIVWLRPAWISGSEARTDGASISFVDELEAGFLVRLVRQHRYWSRTSAGGGLALGVGYRELVDTRMLSVLVGFDFAGEQ